VLPIVPMFHVNAVGHPYSAPLVGAELVLPGPGLDGKSLYELFESEKVESVAGVPTVWLGRHQLHEAARPQVLEFKSTTIAARHVRRDDETLPRRFRRRGPARLGHDRDESRRYDRQPKGEARDLTPDERDGALAQAGPAAVRRRDEDRRCRRQAAAVRRRRGGNVMVRGPWVVRDYFKSELPSPLSADGWFPTGDVGSIDADGYLTITDRSKDVIKSGGE
jgi:fatty-acyl-CoA synthase